MTSQETPAGGYACLCCGRSGAGHRYACHHCTQDMRRWLVELEDYVVILLATMGPLRSMDTGGIGTAFGSRLPIRADVATLLDYRSGAGAAVFRLRDPRDMDDEPVRSLPGGIHGIACWIREERGDSEPTSWTLVSELRYLRTQIEECSFAQWVDELHSDLKELHSQARSLARDSPRPLAHCLETTCEGMVFWVIKEEGGKRVDEAKCATCQRRYSGTDLVRLGAAEEVAG